MRDYLICRTSILPDYFMKVIKVKEMLKKDPNMNIKDACEKEDISRSTFYKYRNCLFLPEDSKQQATFTLLLDHKRGTLSSVLTVLSGYQVDILTISQSSPVDKTAEVVLEADISEITVPLTDILKEISEKEGVLQVALEKLNA